MSFKILLVDDEAELISALAERLTFRGFEVDWVDSGDQAINLVQSKDFDLAVLDMKMPKYSGLELRKELSILNSKLKFIFLTGHGSQDDYDQGATKAECFLMKPIAIEELIEKINESLSSCTEE